MAKEPTATAVEAVDASHGQRMLEVRVRFWTNGIAPAGPKQVRPRHAWSSGIVRMERNEAHGIQGGDPLPFNSLMELPAAIEKLLIREKVKLHISDRTRRYHQVAPKGKAG